MLKKIEEEYGVEAAIAFELVKKLIEAGKIGADDAAIVWMNLIKEIKKLEKLPENNDVDNAITMF